MAPAFWGHKMRIPFRPLIGLGAFCAAMAFVVIAGVTAPRAEPALQISANCPDTPAESVLPDAGTEAKSPA